MRTIKEPYIHTRRGLCGYQIEFIREKQMGIPIEGYKDENRAAYRK